MNKELILKTVDSILKNKSEVISENIAEKLVYQLSDYGLDFSTLNRVLYEPVFDELNSTLRDYIHNALK